MRGLQILPQSPPPPPHPKKKTPHQCHCKDKMQLTLSHCENPQLSVTTGKRNCNKISWFWSCSSNPNSFEFDLCKMLVDVWNLDKSPTPTPKISINTWNWISWLCRQTDIMVVGEVSTRLAICFWQILEEDNSHENYYWESLQQDRNWHSWCKHCCGQLMKSLVSWKHFPVKMRKTFCFNRKCANTVL